MASAVDIANIALSHIGADAVVSQLSPPDGSVEAGHCARFLPIARQAALAAHAWSFASKRVQLAELLNDSEEWMYRYAVPSDCLRARQVLSGDDADARERGAARFTVAGSALYTDQPAAVLVYTTDVTDTTKYPADFVTALGMMLAGYVAGPLIKGSEGMRIGDGWMQRGMAAMSAAAARDASASNEPAQHTPAALKARA